MSIPHVLAHVLEQPWALRPATLAMMRAILVRKHLGHRLSPEEIAAAIEPRSSRADVRLFDIETGEFCTAGPDQAYYSETTGRPVQQSKGGVVAVLGVMGVISQRASQVDDISGPGGTSIERLTQRFRSALNDNGVKAIVFDVDSPGGGVYGVQELADEIRAARGQKPMVAVANSLAASAAYWLASAADELVVAPSGEVGSIGVFSAHEDLSGLLEAEGVKVTLVSAGKFKTEGNPFEALGEEARGAIQSRVDDYYNAFVKAVSKGRGVPVESVRKGMGQGRVVGAKQAMAEKMADREGTLDDTVRRLASKRPEAASAATSTTTEPSRVTVSVGGGVVVSGWNDKLDFVSDVTYHPPASDEDAKAAAEVEVEADAARQRAMIGS